MVEIISMKDDIVKVLFYMNLIFLAIGIFISSKPYFIIVIVINIVLNGTLMVMIKWGDKFESQHKKMWETK